MINHFYHVDWGQDAPFKHVLLLLYIRYYINKHMVNVGKNIGSEVAIHF